MGVIALPRPITVYGYKRKRDDEYEELDEGDFYLLKIQRYVERGRMCHFVDENLEAVAGL